MFVYSSIRLSNIIGRPILNTSRPDVTELNAMRLSELGAWRAGLSPKHLLMNADFYQHSQMNESECLFLY